MAVSVLPSPVRISAILPLCSAMPPISCTSKWRIFIDALAGLAHRRRRPRAAGRRASALGQAVLELGRLALQRLVAQRRGGGLERGDLLDDAPVLLEQAIVSATENLGKKLGQHAWVLGREGRPRTTHGGRFGRSRL